MLRVSLIMFVVFFFFKQKTAYEMRISDWSSDVCSSDLSLRIRLPARQFVCRASVPDRRSRIAAEGRQSAAELGRSQSRAVQYAVGIQSARRASARHARFGAKPAAAGNATRGRRPDADRSAGI